MRIPRLWANAIADALPVVLCRCRNPVSVVTTANFVGSLKFAERILHSRKGGLGGDAGVESCCNIFRSAVNALYVLQQANNLRCRLRQRVLKLLRNG